MSNIAALQSPPPDLVETEDSVTMTTRFGTFSFNRAAAITMPRGIPGFSEQREFSLADLGEEIPGQFKLMQSLQDPNISFLIAPMSLESCPISEADLGDALNALGINAEDVAIVLIVTIRRIGESAQVTVNLRAPIFIDTRNQLAWQHVFPNPDYPVRYVLQAETAAAQDAQNQG